MPSPLMRCPAELGILLPTRRAVPEPSSYAFPGATSRIVGLLQAADLCHPCYPELDKAGNISIIHLTWLAVRTRSPTDFWPILEGGESSGLFHQRSPQGGRAAYMAVDERMFAICWG